MKTKGIIILTIVATFVCLVGISLFLNSTDLPTGNVVAEVTKNKTEVRDDSEQIMDKTLEELEKYKNDPRIGDGKLYIQTELKDDYSTEINLTSLALQNLGFYPGWTTFLYGKKEIPSFISSRKIDGQTYNKIYLYLPQVKIEKDGVEKEAVIPSNRIFIEGDFVRLSSNETGYLKLIFINNNETFFQTTEEEFVYAPKINILYYKNATVSNDELENGTLWTNITVGMDINGRVMSGLGIDSEKEIKYVNSSLEYV